jgi:hypothetical protein
LVVTALNVTLNSTKTQAYAVPVLTSVPTAFFVLMGLLVTNAKSAMTLLLAPHVLLVTSPPQQTLSPAPLALQSACSATRVATNTPVRFALLGSRALSAIAVTKATTELTVPLVLQVISPIRDSAVPVQ